MIESFKDLEITKEDEAEDIEKKVQEKLGLSFSQMHERLANYINDNVDIVVADMINIAPYGDYGELLEEVDEMVTFLKSDVVKTENWKLEGVKSMNEQALQFRFASTAVDDGDTFKGFVVVSFAGKIQHAFCHGEF